MPALSTIALVTAATAAVAGATSTAVQGSQARKSAEHDADRLRLEQEEEKARLEDERKKEADKLAMSLEQARSRSFQRRPARRGTIATSPLGITNTGEQTSSQKTLLGQ
jgi:hypothetical protein